MKQNGCLGKNFHWHLPHTPLSHITATTTLWKSSITKFMRVTGRSERKTAEKVAEKWVEWEWVGRESPLVQLLNKFLNTQVALSPLASRRSQANVAKFKWLERNARLFQWWWWRWGLRCWVLGNWLVFLPSTFDFCGGKVFPPPGQEFGTELQLGLASTVFVQEFMLITFRLSVLACVKLCCW